MNSTERVKNAILGKPIDRQPIYGWVSANLADEISGVFGSVEAFEDHYQFDMAHIFGGLSPYRKDVIERLRTENEELTPDLLVDADFFTDPDRIEDYQNIRESILFHKKGNVSAMCRRPVFLKALIKSLKSRISSYGWRCTRMN